MKKRFKHSGATGDLIYSLALMKHFGGGEFYLHLDQMNWIGQHYYGSPPTAFHQNRLNGRDFEYMKSFMLSQPYITRFDVMGQDTEITHNLDRFRPLFVGHPGNYVDIYCDAFAITDPTMKQVIRTTPWLTVAEPDVRTLGKVVINRTERWLPPELPPQWAEWKAMGLEKDAVFVGLPQEHALFQTALGLRVDYIETPTMLDLAKIIAGAQLFIGNQSQCLALAIGLGVNYCCELRRDLPIERNECYFPQQPGGNYF